MVCLTVNYWGLLGDIALVLAGMTVAGVVFCARDHHRRSGDGSLHD